MSFQEFLEKHNGEWVEVSGSAALSQCVDLANAYLRDVLNQPIVEWTNAIDFPSKLTEKFDYILNTPIGVPLEGDLVIWGGQYGHIAIFIEGNTNTFKSFDQNYPIGSNSHVQGHTYANVLGWLRLKEIQACDPNWRIERDTNWNLYQGQIEENKKFIERITVLERQVNEYKTKFETEQKSNFNLNDALEKVAGQDKDYTQEVLDAQHRADDLTIYLNALFDALGLPRTQVYDQKAIDEALEKIKVLNQPHEEIAKQILPILEGFWKNLRKGRARNLIDRIKIWLK